MPTTENERRNQQLPVLEHPSLPDHDRTRDEGMHRAEPTAPEETVTGPGALDESEIAAPDQAFGQILSKGPDANRGRIPDDPNNWLTSDHSLAGDQNPEDRGESLMDVDDPDRR